MTRLRTLLAATVAVVGAVGGVTAAHGYWSTAGSGTGSAGAGTLSALNVQTATGTPSSALLPGGSADLVLAVKNPNAFSVTIVAITADTSKSMGITGAKDATTCTATAAGLTLSSAPLSITVPPGSGTQTFHVPSGVAMSSSAPSGCQGAAFAIPTKVSIQR